MGSEGYEKEKVNYLSYDVSIRSKCDAGVFCL